MDATKLKVIFSVVIITLGTVLGGMISFSGEVHGRQSGGLLIDFGDYDVRWVDADVDSYDNSLDLLRYCCGYLSFSLTVDDGVVVEINGVSSGKDGEWGLWTTVGTEWVRHTSDVSPGGHTVVAWAYCADDETPVVSVDALGNSIFGYDKAERVVSLSPSITELIGSLRAVDTLVGTDLYSNYPHSVERGHQNGDIAIVGGYTNPSFEKIVACNPDLVICDGSQYSHIEMCKKLNRSGITAVTVYDGTNVDAIKKNLFITGQVIGYDLATMDVLSDIDHAVLNVSHRVMSDVNHLDVRTLIALSGNKAPHASGNNTYADDTLDYVSGINVIAQNGWVHISSEVIAEANPDVIVVVSSVYSNTDSDYQALLDNLSDEWKSTNAYKNGRIYLICEGAADLAQRASPRVIQLMELLGRILQPDVFTDIDVPKHIGSNYSEYLDYTKEYSYDN